MKLRTISRTLASISIMAVLIFGIAAYHITQQLRIANKEAIQTYKIQEKISGSRTLLFEYLLFHNERARAQWWSIYDEMGRLLLPSSFNNPGERILLEKILRNYSLIDDIFTQLVINYEKGRLSKEETPFLKELEPRLVSQLVLQTQEMNYSVFELAGLCRRETQFYQQQTIFLSLILLTVLGIVVILNSILLARRVVGPISKLHQGAEIIGSGNLDYRIDIFSKDEIGQLALSFNQMVEDLKKQRAQLVGKAYVDSIIASMIDTLIVIDPAGKIKTINKATCDLLGYSEAELIGKDVSLIFTEEEEEEEERFFKGKGLKELIEQGSMHNVEMTYLTKSGEKIPVSFSGSVMREREGKLVGVVGVARDMRQVLKFISDLEKSKKELAEWSKTLEKKVEERTKDLTAAQEASLNIMEDITEANLDLKKTKEELELQSWGLTKANEGIKVLYKELKNTNAQLSKLTQTITTERNRLESILKSMAEAVLVVDEYRSIILSNPIAEILLGVRNEEMIGKSIDSAILQEDIRLLFNTFMSQQNEYLIRELKLTSPKDGIARIIKANITKMHDYLGNLVGAVIVFHDITKEKEVDRLKTEFISITSHELRTPLATIKNTITLLLNSATGPINDNQRKFLDMARRNIDRLAALINNLLDLSKIESGKMELTRSEVDINAIAEEVTAAFSSLAKDKKVELKAELDNGLTRISADKDKIFQVVNNLISNALKFTQPQGSVTIRTSVYASDKNYVQVSIRDTGIGIDKKDFDKLFQRFQQLDSALSRKTTGTGLGLVISKQIIELHGGKIWVDSEPGKGSIFSFILPVTHLDEKMGKKILVIDDEQDLCETVKAQLEANNFKVSTAQNGQEGLDKAKSYEPDLIILDLMMPVMDGFEVYKMLKKDSKTTSIPVIVLTALKQEDAAKKALLMGVEGYMVKPFEQEALLFTIREFLK